MNINTSRLLAATSLVLSFLAGPAEAQSTPQAPLPTIDLTAGGMHVIRAEIARAPMERAVGMMMRTEMPANAGMLFVFEQAGPHCFWMSNTLLPLSIAFIADDGTVVAIEEMQARTLDQHCSPKPVRFALEMNQGWFAKRGIKPGSRIAGAPFSGK